MPDEGVVHRELRRRNVTGRCSGKNIAAGPAARTVLATPGSAICTANGPNG